MKRVIIFIATNIAIMLMLSIIVYALGLDKYMSRSGGLNYTTLLGFSAVMGFGGAFISLWLSKPIAKWTTGAEVIKQARNQQEQWLLNTVQKHALAAGVAMPEVAIYAGEANAFATGATKNSALIAVSTGLLDSMPAIEIEAVLAHEMAHVANGDMVTLTLIQGVMNTFVFFLARVIGYFVDLFLRRDEESSGNGIAYMVTVFIAQMVLGILASLIVLYFSRLREFRADAGAAKIMGQPHSMIAALRRLGGLAPEGLPSNLAASGIGGGGGKSHWFSTHPSMEERIQALENR
jgi:heat shock protein HtpX